MKLIDILNLHREEYDLNLKEGLTKTTNLGKTVNILEKIYKFIFTKTKSNSFYAKTFHTDIDTLNNGLIKTANNLGWFPSYIETDDYMGKWGDNVFKKGEIKIRFEAKFDEEVIENIPKFLYHITPIQNADKIISMGLVPKSRSKLSYHPERVYLAKSPKDLEDLLPLMYQTTGNKNYTILKIDTDLISGGYFKLYKDPNFSKGYYAMNNITPGSITRLKDLTYGN